jgi:hypothetical protein
MVRFKSLANSQVEGKEMEETLVPKGEQRIEGGEEGKNHNAGARARMELLAKHAVRPAELT